MSTKRLMAGGYTKPADLPKGEAGRALCRWCNLEVPTPRRTFCSEWCVHEWRIRSDAGYLRSRVLARDQGICAICREDTLRAWLELKRARGDRRTQRLRHWGLARMSRKSLWDADHIVPVVEGGGECDLSNIRTLCLRCHADVTLNLRQRLTSRRGAGNASAK